MTIRVIHSALHALYRLVVEFFKKPREDNNEGDAWVEFVEPHAFIDPECGHIYVKAEV